MKKIILSIIILFSIISYAASHIEHYKMYNYLEYELFRNNKSIGFHKYEFDRKGDNLTVKSEVKFNISKLGVNLYEYFAKSDEIYKNNKFFKFSAKTNQNKKQKFVDIVVDPLDKDLVINGSSFQGKTSKKHIVGTWWNHEIINAKAQISAISGRIIEQKVTFVGKDQITIGDKTYNALHFNFKSSDTSLPENKKLNTDIWYEEGTYLWLKATFNKRGFWEYRLKTYK